MNRAVDWSSVSGGAIAMSVVVCTLALVLSEIDVIPTSAGGWLGMISVVAMAALLVIREICE